MNISITGRHLEVTPSLKEYVQKKVEKVKYYFEHIINVHVILEVRKLMHCAEVTILSDEKTFFCEVSSNDMYESIDLLFGKIERQIRRNKEKYSQRKAKSLASNFTSQSDVKEPESLVITKVKEVAPKPMTEHEAILQLALNNHNFEIFNEEKEAMIESIALKKENNIYALIQRNSGKWFKREIKLESDEIVEIEKSDYSIDYIQMSDAIGQIVNNHSDKYLIFHDPEVNSLNILYYRKDQSLGLLTSGGTL